MTYDSRSGSSGPMFGNEGFPPSSALVQVEFGAGSHPGVLQATNDDHYLIARIGRYLEPIMTSLPEGAAPRRFDESGYGMVVADGMGGVGSERASRLAIATLTHVALQWGKWNVRVDDETAWVIAEQAERFYRQVDEAVSAAARSDPGFEGMGTTLTCTYSGGDELFVVHVGHSRAYVYRAGHLTKLTRDQTLAHGCSNPAAPHPPNSPHGTCGTS